MTAEWTLSDAWMFAAISTDRPDVAFSLAQIIAHADFINHAIPLESEFTAAVGRLVAAGLLGADPVADRYWTTEAGTALHGRWKGPGWIQAIPPRLRDRPVPASAPACPLAPGAYDAAVHAYLNPTR